MSLDLIFVWLEGFGRTLAIVITILSSILFSMYRVFFNARFGGTPGKFALGIRITKPDGSRIGWPEAWKRASVDLLLALVFLVVEVWALTQVDPSRYASMSWLERQLLLQEHSTAWFNILLSVWLLSNIVVLLFNKRKRAIHDFIAGTVVTKKEFAEQKDGQLSSEGALSDEVLT
jgi:uncharacterized RDD family membrane protein YckC